MLKILKEFKIRAFPQYYDGVTIYGKRPGCFEEVRSLSEHYISYEAEIKQLLERIENIKSELTEVRKLARSKKGRRKLSNFIDTYDSISVEDFILG